MFVNARDYLGLPRAPESWIIENVLPTSGLLNIFGPPKAGKTFAAVDLAIAVSDPNRTHYLEWAVKTHGPVFYCQIDTPRMLFQDDYIAAAVEMGCNINQLAIVDQQMVPYPFNILGDGKQFLRDAIQSAEEKPVAVIVDTLRDAHGGDENDSGIMRNVVTSFVDAIRPTIDQEWTMPALVLLTHQKKLQQDQVFDLMSGNRGSNYLAGRMDCVMAISADTIQAQSRSMKLTKLDGYRRNPHGFWVKCDMNEEIKKCLQLVFPSDNVRFATFAAQWDLSKATAQNYFRNYRERGGFDKYPKAS